MAQITSGRVSYRRTIQPAEYESKTAECEFSFTLEDGDDAGTVAADTLALARAEVHTALGIEKRKG